MGNDKFIKNQSLIICVTESSLETLNACEEMVRREYHREYCKETGKITPMPTGDKLHTKHDGLHCPEMLNLSKSFKWSY